MQRLVLAAVFALLIAVSTSLAIGGTSSAVAQDGLAPVEADSTPMLEALSLLPLGIDAFEFTDWAALKAAHGGADVSSASPLAERQQLMLDLARSEATTFPFGSRSSRHVVRTLGLGYHRPRLAGLLLQRLRLLHPPFPRGLGCWAVHGAIGGRRLRAA